MPEIILVEPSDGAEISFLTREQKKFLSDPHHRFAPHELELEPRKADLTLPQAVSFRWNSGGTEAELQISETADFSRITVSSSGRDSVSVSNLPHGRKYYWRVKCGQKISEVRSFTVAAELPRWINMPEVTNVRDLGGWKTTDGRCIRQGMIFRGAQLESWTNQKTGSTINETGRKVFLETMKIHTELDLRGGPGSSLPVKQYVSIPLSAYATWAENGIFTSEQMKFYRQIFELLADPAAYPVYFHCQGGGDRTGTMAFLLEAMLGLEKESLLTEYELSNLSVSGERSRFSEVWLKFMEKLDTLLPGGSLNQQACRYLNQCGISDEIMEKIRSILLE